MTFRSSADKQKFSNQPFRDVPGISPAAGKSLWSTERYGFGFPLLPNSEWHPLTFTAPSTWNSSLRTPKRSVRRAARPATVRIAGCCGGDAGSRTDGQTKIFKSAFPRIGEFPLEYGAKRFRASVPREQWPVSPSRLLTVLSARHVPLRTLKESVRRAAMPATVRIAGCCGGDAGSRTGGQTNF